MSEEKHEPRENELFKIYVTEGICDSVPFKCSLSRQPSDGYYAALRIWRKRNPEPALDAAKEGK